MGTQLHNHGRRDRELRGEPLRRTPYERPVLLVSTFPREQIWLFLGHGCAARSAPKLVWPCGTPGKRPASQSTHTRGSVPSHSIRCMKLHLNADPRQKGANTNIASGLMCGVFCNTQVSCCPAVPMPGLSPLSSFFLSFLYDETPGSAALSLRVLFDATRR